MHILGKNLASARACVRVCAHTCVRACMYVCMHAYMSACVRVCACTRVCACSVARLCLTVCNYMDCNLPGPSVHTSFKQEHWSGLPFPSPGDPPKAGIKLTSSTSPAFAGGFFKLSHLGSPPRAQ